MINLYTEDGWLDTTALLSIPNINFIICIGPRQVGKSYGFMRDLMSEKVIYMRRSTGEVDVALKGKDNIFSVMTNDFGHEFEFTKESDYVTTINIDKEDRWTAMSLFGVAHVRGFSGDSFDYLLYDEFIPEQSVKKISGEGDAFINAYVTLNGNRELKGRPALKCILLANSNNLNSPILQAFNLVSKVERMSRENQEYSLLADRGILLILPKSEKITGKRAETALYRAIGTNSEVAQMQLANKFSYNDFSDVYSENLKSFTPVFVHANTCVYRSKIDRHYYVCDKIDDKVPVCRKMTRVGLRKWITNHGYPSFLEEFQLRQVVYSNYKVKGIWEDLLNTERK